MDRVDSIVGPAAASGSSPGIFGGILAAVVTPFDSHGRFQRDRFEPLLARLYAAGVDGVYVCGTTGEGMLQPASQRREVAEAAIEQSPGAAQVIVHVGAPAISDSIALARHAGRAGAAAVSSLPPTGDFSFPEIRDYYLRVAEAAEVPLFLYYYPALASSPLDLDQLLTLCRLPGISGIKLTDFDLYRLWALKAEGITVFNGRDEVLVAGLLMGADGGIGTFYNLLPESVARLYRHARAEDWVAAREEQDRLNRLVRAVSAYPLFPAVKQILEWSGFPCGHCLSPRAPLTADEAASLRRALERAGLNELLRDSAGHE